MAEVRPKRLVRVADFCFTESLDEEAKPDAAELLRRKRRYSTKWPTTLGAPTIRKRFGCGKR